MNLCVIPARAGSKRIKKKNIKLFFGKPIIAWSIETAIEVDGNHIIIVGSAIIFDENPADMARQFAEKSWQSFETCNPSLIDECKNFLEDLVDYSKRRPKSNYVIEECQDILE